MNRTIKEATTQAFHYTSLIQLQSHLNDYPRAYNSTQPFRVFEGNMPFGFMLEQWQKEPERFMTIQTITSLDQTYKNSIEIPRYAMPATSRPVTSSRCTTQPTLTELAKYLLILFLASPRPSLVDIMLGPVPMPRA
jgi:hypothetical protein